MLSTKLPEFELRFARETAVDRITVRLLKPHLTWSGFSAEPCSIDYGSFHDLDYSSERIALLKAVLPFAVPGDQDTFENEHYLSISIRELDGFEVLNEHLNLQGRSLNAVARALRARGEFIAIYKKGKKGVSELIDLNHNSDSHYCDGNVSEMAVPTGDS